MRLWIKILFTGIIILALLFSAVYLFLLSQGKTLIIRELESLTKKKVSIGYFGLTSPFRLQIKDLNIEGLSKIDSIFISPNILGFLTGTIAFNSIKIIRPELVYERVLPQTLELTGTAAPSSPVMATSLPTGESKPRRPLRFIFKRLKIKEGKIDFNDRTVGTAGIKLSIKDIDFNLTNLYLFPRSVITNFALRASIPWQQGEEKGRIEVEGWLNLFKKDMQATLKIEDIEGVYLYPYYSQWVDLEKARIQSAKLNFISNMHALNNNLTAECRLELTDIVRRPLSPEESQEKAARITDAVLDIFRAFNQGKIVLDFTIRTKMDRPEFGFGNIKMAFEDKLAQAKTNNGFKVQDILMLPSNIIQGTVKSATDLSKAVISGTFSVGKELKKAVEETFKREKTEE